MVYCLSKTIIKTSLLNMEKRRIFNLIYKRKKNMNWTILDLVKFIKRLDEEQKKELNELKQLIRELKIELVLKNKNDEYGNDNN